MSLSTCHTTLFSVDSPLAGPPAVWQLAMRMEVRRILARTNAFFRCVMVNKEMVATKIRQKNLDYADWMDFLDYGSSNKLRKRHCEEPSTTKGSRRRRSNPLV